MQVNYFTLPEESTPALIRQVTIENVSRKKYAIELLDGLPSIIPYGMTDWLLKNMSRTVEAWGKVRNLKHQAPFYHLKVVVSDRPAVSHITEGNFYFAFEKGGRSSSLLPPIRINKILAISADRGGRRYLWKLPGFYLSGKILHSKTIRGSQKTRNVQPHPVRHEF